MDYEGIDIENREGFGRLVLESMGEGVCVLDGEGRTTFTNPAAARLTGYAPEEIVGGIHHDVLGHFSEAGDLYSMEECPLCGAFLRGEPRDGTDAMFRRKDGSGLPVGYSSDPIIKDGEVAGAVVVFRDLSGLREGESLESLQGRTGRGERGEGALGRDARLARLAEESIEGLALSENGRIFNANRVFLEMFGYELDQVLGMASAEFVVPEDRGLVGRRLSSESAAAYEARGLRKDGTIFPIEVRPRRVPYEDRHVRLTSVIDLTERQRAEKELRGQRDLYEGILTAQSELGEGCIMVEDQSVTYANEAFLEISGYTLEELLAVPSFLELIPEEDRADLLERRQRRIETGEGETRYETGMRRKDGQRLDVEVAFKVFENETPLRFMIVVRDIRRRKKAEAELKSSEEQYRSLFETMTQGIIYHDAEGRIVAANPAAQEILGSSLDRMQGKTSMDPGWRAIRKDGTELPGEEHPVMISLRTGEKVEDTVMGVFIPEKDEYRWLRISAVPQFREGEKKPYRVYAIFDDITRRKLAEEELRRNERSLVEAQRIASFGNWEYDLKEDEARWSEELYRIFGHEPQSFVPRYRSFFEAVHPEDRAAVREGAQAALSGGSGSGIDFRVVRPNGEVRTIHARYEVIRSALGRPRKLVGTVHDITGRRRAEEALRQSEERFRAMIQNASDIVTVLEADGAIRYESPAIERVLGYTPEELVGTNAFDHVHPDDLDTVMHTFTEALEKGSPTASAEIRFRHKDGSWRYLEAIGTNLLREPAIRGLVINSRDVTERKQYEEELQRSNAELERFAYIASHDLQEPLRMVSSYTQLLARRYRGQLDKDAEEFIGYAVDGAERMQRLINDLLSYSRVGTRGGGLKPTELSTVVEAAMANLRLALEESGARVTADTLPIVMGDRPQLVQLFQNLIGNAIKFRGEEPPEIHVGAELWDGKWLISVRDNGIGLDPEYADRIFVIFQRLHGRGRYEGTGIGLAICKRIVERHEGKIWVESAPGEGSAFYFTLPAGQERDG